MPSIDSQDSIGGDGTLKTCLVIRVVAHGRENHSPKETYQLVALGTVPLNDGQLAPYTMGPISSLVMSAQRIFITGEGTEA